MTFQKIAIHNRNLDARISSMRNWKISNEDKEDLLLFLRDLSIGKINQGKKICEARQLKYLEILKITLNYFKKPTSKIVLGDMENFDLDLSKNKIKRNDGKPYSEETKGDIRRLFKVYLKWKLKSQPLIFTELTSWIDTRVSKIRTPEFLSEEEVEKLYKSCKNARERFLITVLFDSGARAEEFHNIRYEDIIPPSNNQNYYKITLKEEYSKTCGRTIGLYWKYSNEAIKEFLEERIKNGIKSGEPVFNITYDASRLFLSRFGLKILNKRVHFHLFRHSSATFYSIKLNRQELCYRYGWKFSSDMPDTYISRSGIMERQVEEKFSKTDLEELNIKFREQEQKCKILNEKVERNEEENEIIADKLKRLLDIFKENKDLMKLVVKKDREKLSKVIK